MVGIQTERIPVADGYLTNENSSYLRASNPNLPIGELRKRYNEDGYLFLKQLLPREDVLKARQKYFQRLTDTGILQEDTSPMEGIFNSRKSPEDFPGFGSGTPGKGEYAEEFVMRALDAHYEDWYTQDFCKHPVLHQFVANFTGWGENTMGMKRSLLRNNVPHSTPIGVHYDQIFLRYGDPTSVTAWVPMGDIKLSGGGLMYLEGGESVGKSIEDAFTHKAIAGGMSEEQARSAYNANMMSNGLLSANPLRFATGHQRRWLATAYEAGDVVLHKPHAIHASTINNDPDHIIRLGTDLRFCDRSRPYDPRWTNYFRIGDGA